MGQGEQPLEVAQAREVWLAVVGGRWVRGGGHVGENGICCEQVKPVRAHSLQHVASVLITTPP